MKGDTASRRRKRLADPAQVEPPPAAPATEASREWDAVHVEAQVREVLRASERSREDAECLGVLVVMVLVRDGRPVVVAHATPSLATTAEAARILVSECREDFQGARSGARKE